MGFQIKRFNTPRTCQRRMMLQVLAKWQRFCRDGELVGDPRISGSVSSRPRRASVHATDRLRSSAARVYRARARPRPRAASTPHFHRPGSPFLPGDGAAPRDAGIFRFVYAIWTGASSTAKCVGKIAAKPWARLAPAHPAGTLHLSARGIARAPRRHRAVYPIQNPRV